MRKRKHFWAIALFLTMTACEDPYLGEPFVVYDIIPIASYLESRSEEFSSWIALLKQVDLYNAVNQSSTPFTMMAPTNEAMERYCREKRVKDVAALEDALGRDYLRQLVLYHLLTAQVPMETVIQGGQLPAPTYTGDYLEIRFGEVNQTQYGDDISGGYNSLYINGETHIRELALEAANGLVYVIDDVMRPMIDPLPRVMYEKGGNDIMYEALKLTSWADTLSILSDSLTYKNKEYRFNRYYTFLSVPDEVFRTKGINSVEDLASTLGAGPDFTHPGNALNRYVAYHILKGYRSVANLNSFDVPKGDSSLLVRERCWPTCCDNALIKVSQGDDGVFRLNAESGTASASIEEDGSDYKVKNGVIHQLTDILPVSESLSPIRYIYDFADLDRIQAFVETHGVAGQIYQYPAKNLQTALPTNLPIFRVFSGPQGTKVSQPIQYCTAGPKSGSLHALNGDWLSVGIGYLSHITFRLPMILPGKYKVTLSYVYDTSLAGFKVYQNGSDGGLTTVSFVDRPDIEPSRWLFYSSIPESSTDYLFDMPVAESVTFDQAGEHVLRIQLDDPAASLSNRYCVLLDYIMFEPID